MLFLREIFGDLGCSGIGLVAIILAICAFIAWLSDRENSDLERIKRWNKRHL